MKKEKDIDFGSYVQIEQKRYGVKNEKYTYKVIGKLQSNTWVDVPVQIPAIETIHKEMAEVVQAICCGVDETEVLKYRVEDLAKLTTSPPIKSGLTGGGIEL